MKILLVEDQALIGLLLAAELRTLGHEPVGPIQHEGAALDAVESGDVDAALLDYRLGEGPVTRLVGLLQQRSIPFAWFTGASAADLPPGDAPVLGKPLVRDDLQSVVGQLEARRQVSRPSHVRLVEDDRGYAYAVARHLANQGHRVTVCHDGAEALRADARDPADAIVLDLRLPDQHGSAVAASLRERRPTLPIMVLTNWPGDLAGPGIDVVVDKSADLEVIAAKVRSIVGRQVAA